MCNTQSRYGCRSGWYARVYLQYQLCVTCGVNSLPSLQRWVHRIHIVDGAPTLSLFLYKGIAVRSTTWRSFGSSKVCNVQRIILHSHDSNGCFLCLHPFWAENQHPSTFFSFLQLVSSNTSWMQPRVAVKAQLGVTAVFKCRKKVVFWNLPHCCPPLVHLL